MAKHKKEVVAYASTPYIQIPQGLFFSKEFNQLSPHARCIYLLFLGKLKPMNTEKKDRGIVMRYEDIRSITGFNPATISKCLKELVKDGFIDIDFFGSYPHNVSIYQVNMKVLKKAYPKLNKGLPEYLTKGAI